MDDVPVSWNVNFDIVFPLKKLWFSLCNEVSPLMKAERFSRNIQRTTGRAHLMESMVLVTSLSGHNRKVSVCLVKVC